MSTDPKPDAILWVRLPRELHARLQAEAESNHRSMSGHARWILDKELPRADASVETAA